MPGKRYLKRMVVMWYVFFLVRIWDFSQNEFTYTVPISRIISKFGSSDSIYTRVVGNKTF